MVVFKLMCFYAFVDPTTTTTTEPSTNTTDPYTVSLPPLTTAKYTTASSIERTSFRTRTAIPDNTNSE